MTASNVAGDSSGATGSGSLGSAFRVLSEATVQYALTKGSQKVGDWTRRLEEIAAPSGVVERAGFEGLKAYLSGKNPVWAAIKGGWQGTSGGVKAAILVSLVLLVVLSPGLVLLLLIGLIVAAVVAGLRAADR
jgi:hypothetical protein